MLVSLYDLRIGITFGAGARPAPDACDVRLTVSREGTLAVPMTDPLTVSVVRCGDASCLEHAFSYKGSECCRFRVSPDGRHVDAVAAHWVAEDDLLGLFFETVMRSVLCRLGCVSLHSAALRRDGPAILILGDKGAGKSTLGGALRLLGWAPLADDLVRLANHDGLWCAAAGSRGTKLTADSAAALGFKPGDMPTRWSVPDAMDNKFYMAPSKAVSNGAVPIAAILILGPRAAGSETMILETMSAGASVAALVKNLTPDPMRPGGRPEPQAIEAISGLLRQARVYRLVLPDSFDRLQASAVELDAFVTGVLNRVQSAASAEARVHA